MAVPGSQIAGSAATVEVTASQSSICAGGNVGGKTGKPP